MEIPSLLPNLPFYHDNTELTKTSLPPPPPLVKFFTSAAKKKHGIADLNSYIRRSKRLSDDTIDSSPEYPRNNRENNSASYPQQHQQRQQSSNPVTSKSATRGRRKKDPSQRTCDTWLEKSTKQGMIIDEFDDNDGEYEFDGTYENSNSKSTRDVSCIIFCSQVDQESHSSSFASLQKNGTILNLLADPAPVPGVANVLKKPREKVSTT